MGHKWNSAKAGRRQLQAHVRLDLTAGVLENLCPGRANHSDAQLRFWTRMLLGLRLALHQIHAPFLGNPLSWANVGWSAEVGDGAA